ncbi:MAG TPA: YjjG family noncanonical pyrimidine nucleotidase [Edaphocola sp.]|nr:YjjG family noncanonical pyrimidine nucleotidase [Edaphocola sp.]
MKKYKAVFFDLDHTLWDFEANSKATLHHIYYHYHLAAAGVPDFEAFYQSYKFHNERLWDRYRKGFISRNELKWKRMWLTLLDFKIADEPKAKELAEVFITMLPQQTQLFPHAEKVLDYCQAKGYRLALITNGFEDTQMKKLASCNIAKYFQHVVTSERSQSVKPHAQIFEYALSISDATAPEALMIGDSLDVDISGAQNVGMDQVYFNPLREQHQQQPTYEIDCLSQLLQIL